MTRCYLGLGSNLRSPNRQLRRALVELRQLPRSVIVATSPIHSTKPWGMRGQPNYANMVIAIETKLPAQAVLAYCQQIE
jgi:2-amino-4-hydroxy-6-hydroxymethyldihydropteridine diphosphokinase